MRWSSRTGGWPRSSTTCFEQSLDTLLDRIADTLDDLVPDDALQIYEADNTRNELIPVLARSE